MQRTWFALFGHGAAAVLGLAVACLLATASPVSAAPKEIAGLKSITLTPAVPVVALGLKQQFLATGAYSNGTTQDLTDTATWRSSAPETAAVSNAAGTRGLATTLTEGKAVITAAIGNVSGSTTLVVTPPALVSIRVTPSLPTITTEQLQFAATGIYTNGKAGNLTPTAAWTSGTPATATIAAGGLATALAEGRTLITATVGGISGATTLFVTPDVTKVGSTSAMGSLLVFPRIHVDAGVDTHITVVNDWAYAVNAHCFYHTSDRLPTPAAGAPGAGTNHWVDFVLHLTHNQPLTWSAATGLAIGSGLPVAPEFGNYGGVIRPAGALTCFAETADRSRAVNVNRLFGNAAIASTSGQVWSYNAWAFEALEGTGASVPGGPVYPPPVSVGGRLTGQLLLNGRSTLTPEGVVTETGAFAACQNSMTARFTAIGAPAAGGTPVPGATSGGPLNVTLAACTQDLTPSAVSTISRYIYTFWNEDESMRTGDYECAASWYESNFPAASAGGQHLIWGAQWVTLQTHTATLRIESLQDNSICPGSQRLGFVGVISQAATGGSFLRGTNLIGRGPADRDDMILWDVPPPPEE